MNKKSTLALDMNVIEKAEEWENLRIAAYAAQVESLDCGTGLIIGELRSTGLADNTLAISLGDNGAAPSYLTRMATAQRGEAMRSPGTVMVDQAEKAELHCHRHGFLAPADIVAAQARGLRSGLQCQYR